MLFYGEYSYNIDQKGQSKVLDPLRHFDGNREFWKGKVHHCITWKEFIGLFFVTLSDVTYKISEVW